MGHKVAEDLLSTVLWRISIKSFIGQSQDFEDYSVLDRKPVKFFKNRGNVIVFAGTSE